MTAPATLRRVTPTAMQVLKADAPRELWLAERRKGIGSSDIAKIVGVADRQQAIHVWHDKRGTLTDDDAGEAALWGTLHEDTVAQEWCRRNRSVIQRVGLVSNVDEPWMLTTLDRLVRECPLDREQKTRCALEVKTRSAFKAHRWHKAVPDDVLAQTAWQRRVTGLDHIHVAVLIGGNDYRQMVVRRDDELEGYLVGEGRIFWFNNVIGELEPAWNYDTDHPEDLLDLDKRLHGEKVGELDLDGIGEVMDYAAASAAAGAAERARKAAAAKLARLAEGNRYLKFGGELAYSYEPRSKTNCNLEVLAERYPQAYADPDVITETSYYAIQIAKAYRKGK
jgi:putative phage-type endonuclease